MIPKPPLTIVGIAPNGSWGCMALPGLTRHWRIVDGARIEVRVYHK